jgi:hypothetical protein
MASQKGAQQFTRREHPKDTRKQKAKKGRAKKRGNNTHTTTHKNT